MSQAFSSYLHELGRMLVSVQVQDRGGKALELAAGLERVMGLILRQSGLGKKVIFIGNGGSAAIASHQAVDFWKNGDIRAVAFNDSSLLTCISNDFGYEQVFSKPIEMFADDGDVLVAISSSGRSPNILRGVEAAQRKGGHVVTMSGFEPGNPLRRLGELNFFVPSHSYGFVEITHVSLCHCIVDTIVQSRKKG